MRLATAFVLIVSCAPNAGRPTIASDDAPREHMPSTPPVAEIAPSVDPSSLPDAIRPLAFMPGILTNAGGALLQRSELRADDGSIAVTCGTSGSRTWTCIETDDAMRCFEVPGVARHVPRPVMDRDFGVRVGLHLMSEEGSIRVWLDDDVLSTTSVADGRTETVIVPTPRGPPPVLEALQGIELVSSFGNVLARIGSWISVCAPQGGAFVCMPPRELQALARDPTVIDADFRYAGGVFSFQAEWYAPAGDVYEPERVTLEMFVRVRGEEVMLIAAVPQSAERRTAAWERDDVVVVLVEDGEPDTLDGECLSIRPATIERLRIELEDGRERQLRPPRLRPAPDRVGIEPVDPFTTTMEGAWNILPGGGLERRDEPCPGRVE